MSIRLSPRLLAVARQVPAGARVIDVGTDHARIPVWLAQTGRAAHIWASDIADGPLCAAAALVEKTDTGDRIELRRTDGLHSFGPTDGDTVILAGMGGETMIDILADAGWTREGVLLILEPQSKQAELRRFLLENGYMIDSESLVRDAGRIYPILTVQGGEGRITSEAELHTGSLCQIGKDPLFGEYLAGLIQQTAAAAPYDPAAAERLKEYRDMERRIRHDNS